MKVAGILWRKGEPLWISVRKNAFMWTRSMKPLGSCQDPSRLKIVAALLTSEHCVCDLAAICGQTDSAVSHQLRILRSLRIVKNRRDGKVVYYSLDDDHVVSLLEMSCAHTSHEQPPQS